jgi:hypothetical protein
MSDTLDLTSVSEEPVESNVQVEITDADPDTEEAPVEETTESVEEPEEVSEPVEEASAEETPVEEAPAEETPVEEAPVEEAPVEETPVEEAPVEAPVEEAPVSTTPVQQVATDIRNILTEVPTTTVETSESLVTENLCSLKTLVDVLGKWSGNEIRRRQVENLLKKGTEVDENLDDIEKVVEILQLWIGEGGSTFREHNHFKKLDEYTLSGESRNLSEEKKVEVLKTLIELTINVSQRKLGDSERDDIFNNLY